MPRSVRKLASAASRVSMFLLAFVLAPSAYAQPAKQRDDLLRVSFIDVGQGDAIWIQGPKRHDGKDGINILVDGGPAPSANEGTLRDYFEAYKFSAGSVIDCMVLTHPHDDHLGGLIDVLNDYDVKMIVDAGYPKDEKDSKGKATPFGRFMTAARNERVGGKPAELIRLREHNTGEITFQWGDDSAPDGVPVLEAKILAGFWIGAPEFGSKVNTKENNSSTVVHLTYGNISFLLMGDAEGKDRKDKPDNPGFVEKLLVDQSSGHPEELRSNVLKVGHHGSETSSTVPFMKAVHPDVLVVMSGRKKFGSVFLPDATVLKRYRDQLPGISIVRTDEGDASRTTTDDADGDHIYMYTDGQTLRVYQAKKLTGKWQWVLKRVVQPDTHDEPN